MKAAEITALVTERASRFGWHNPQQFSQLRLRLGKAPPVEVAGGLLQIFTHGLAAPEGSGGQELAGRLLVALRPEADFNLQLVLRSALPRYELSVEQFPEYLCLRFGKEPVLAALSTLEAEPLSSQEGRALDTLRFWVRNISPA